MPELDLDAIRNRANAATRGPWEADEWEIYGDTRAVWIGETCSTDDLPQSRANGEFIAHAREDVPMLLDLVERLEGQLIRATHGHTPGEGQCEKYRCAYCRYCGKEKPCACTGNFTMQIPTSGTDVPRKDFLDEDGLISAVSTIAMLDADGYETAVGLPLGGFQGTGQWHPVERYETPEDAMEGHTRWLALAPTLTEVTDLGNPSDPDSTPTVVDLVAELARLKEGKADHE